MKKTIFSVFAAMTLAATALSTTVFAEGSSTAESASSATDSGGQGPWSWIIMIAIYGAVIAGAYFLLFRPQSKKKKKEAQMRRDAQIGDTITTIGGISGRIVAIKEDTDTLIIETGTDRNHISILRWAVSSVDSQAAPPANESSKSTATTKEISEHKEKHAKKEN